MRIKLLGTGSMISDDNPTCFLVDNHILIDFPNGMLKPLRKAEILHYVDTLIVTHSHADHTFDIPFLLINKMRNHENLNIYSSSFNIRMIKKVFKLGFPHLYNETINYKGFKFISSDNFEIGDILVNRIKVKHGKMRDCFGYSLSYKDKIVSFTGDSTFCDNVVEMACNSNVIFADCMNVLSSLKHMGINDICYLLNKNSKLEVVPVHLTKESKNALKKLGNKRLLIKDDGDEIKL